MINVRSLYTYKKETVKFPVIFEKRIRNVLDKNHVEKSEEYYTTSV